MISNRTRDIESDRVRSQSRCISSDIRHSSFQDRAEISRWVKIHYSRDKTDITRTAITVMVQAVSTFPSALGVGGGQLISSSYSFHPGVAMLMSTPFGSSTAQRLFPPTQPNGRVKVSLRPCRK